MGLQDYIIERVCEDIIEDELKRSSWFEKKHGYYKIDGCDESFGGAEFIEKLFEIAEEKILNAKEKKLKRENTFEIISKLEELVSNCGAMFFEKKEEAKGLIKELLEILNEESE